MFFVFFLRPIDQWNLGRLIIAEGRKDIVKESRLLLNASHRGNSGSCLATGDVFWVCVRICLDFGRNQTDTPLSSCSLYHHHVTDFCPHNLKSKLRHIYGMVIHLEKPNTSTRLLFIVTYHIQHEYTPTTVVQHTDLALVFPMYFFQPEFGWRGTIFSSNSRCQESPCLRSFASVSKILDHKESILSMSVVLVAEEEAIPWQLIWSVQYTVNYIEKLISLPWSYQYIWGKRN